MFNFKFVFRLRFELHSSDKEDIFTMNFDPVIQKLYSLLFGSAKFNT